MDLQKHIGNRKAYYYMAKLTPKEINAIKFRKIIIWIVCMPIQIWRIPYSIFVMLCQFLSYLGRIESGELRSGLFALATIVLAPAVFSAMNTPILFISVVLVIYAAYMIYRCVQEIRKAYWKTYNEKKGYASEYDEYAAKNAEDEGDYEYNGYGYSYYYDASENKGYYSSYGYGAGDSKYSGNSSSYRGNGSGGTTGYKTSKNRFMGLTQDEAKDKYRDLMKIYHPDNAETGDAEISKQIISEYEEYKEYKEMFG